ncbi:HNH endonuclease [Methylocystis parvus]|uniref:HNH endonuclease n=1 Tax=Methylocystis parvus TaxID=134 RepID=UPI003C78F337
MWSGSADAFASRYSISVSIAKRFQCTVEHLAPRSEGGKNRRINLAAACKYCNAARHKSARVRPPQIYREHVEKRLAAGKWHPTECRKLIEKARADVVPRGRLSLQL